MSDGDRLSWFTLAAALLLLNASLTFHNIWPTPAVAWTGAVSIELAILALILIVASSRRRPLNLWTSRLTLVWLVLTIGQYVHVTAPALWGRELNFYWDLRFVPDVASMLIRAAPIYVTVLVAVSIVAVLVLAYFVLRAAMGRLVRAAANAGESRAIVLASGLALVLFAAQRISARVPAIPEFPTPVAMTYARQVRFVAEALTGARKLADSPSFGSDLSLVDGADVWLLFLESYGAVAFERPEFSNVLNGPRAELEKAIRASGHDVVSTYVESPTFGGSSWFAHITLMSGIEVRDPDTNALLMTERRPTLPAAFARHGYRPIAVMPGLWAPWPEGVFYGFADVYTGERLQYKGAPFGWWTLPDQYTFARIDEVEINKAPRDPLFVFFPTVSTHTPFVPRPPYQPDWMRMLTDKPYDDAALERAYDEEPDWTNLGPSYATAVSYAYETLAGYLRRHQNRDVVMVVLGDHQPPALVSGEHAPWDVPVHVISNRRDILERLLMRGFRRGLTPERPSLVRMHVLTSLLLEAFGNSTVNARAAAPTSVSAP